LACKKHVFLVMAGAPPVVDHIKRSTIQEIASSSPFNIFNIVAIVAILVIGYFLYKKFNKKYSRGAIRMPVMPMIPKHAAAAPVIVETVSEEPEDEDEEEPPKKDE